MLAVRRITTLLVMAAWTLLLLPLQVIAVARRAALAEKIPKLYHRGLCRMLGVKVEVRGAPLSTRPVLFVSNHVSWLDILVLTSQLPHAAYVAKHEVASWPVFGYLAKLHDTVFIERKARRTADHRDEMTERLGKGDNLILFPEGTSHDGLRVLPFKSSFFSLAEKEIEGRPLAVQPVAITFSRLNRLPVMRRNMAIYAWVGDQGLVEHLWKFLHVGPTTVVLEFLPPVTIQGFASRKEMARHCREAICQSVYAALTGRPRAAAPAPAAPEEASGSVLEPVSEPAPAPVAVPVLGGGA